MMKMFKAARFKAAMLSTVLLLGYAGGKAMATAPQESQDQAEGQAEAKEIIVRIRKSMREVNKLLLGSSNLSEAEAGMAKTVADLERLLDEAESKAEQVVSGIDELMKLASEQQQGGGGGSQPPPPKGESKDQQSQSKREKSEDPQELADQEPSEGESPKQQQPKEGSEPKGSQPDDAPGKQSQGEKAPPSGETAKFENADTSGRWGVLPSKEAEDLQRHAVEEFPQRYRHWMEMYYKRVNKSRDN